MKYILTLFSIIVFAIPTLAQVGIGTNTPDPSSSLDVNGDDKGILIPRMTLTERDAIQSPADGLLIYQTESTPGFYYYNGTNWITFGSAGWLLSGNTGTIEGQNYAGTADNQELAIGSQGNEVVRVLPNGNVGIGTTAPSTSLHIQGQAVSNIIYAQDFQNTPTGFVSEVITSDPYWIDANTGNCAILSPGQWQVNPNGPAPCTNCTGNRATFTNSRSQCDPNATLVAGPFSSTRASIQVSFDYSLDESPFDDPNFSVFLFNETTQTEETTLLTITDNAEDLSFINTSIIVNIGDQYSLRFRFIGGRVSGITLDNIVVQDNGIAPLRIADGTQAAGRILVSDASGNGSWQEFNDQDFQDDWVFDNPSGTTNLDPIYHQGVVRIGDFSVAQHTLHVQDRNSTAGTNTYWGSVEEVNDGNGFLQFNHGVSPIISSVISLGSPSNRWTTVFTDNGVTTTSDRILKENIQPLTYGLKEVLQLRPVSFQWKEERLDDFVIPESEQETKLGFIAQELLEVLPEMVQTTHWREYEENPGKLQKEEMDRYAVSYSELIPVLVKAIQEQEAQIVALEAQQKRLKKLSKKRK